MNDLTINISWEYFLGIIGALIAIAWYSGSRFSKIETSIEWMKRTINELKTASDNEVNPAFASQSPVNLNERGEDWLISSGLKKYLDERKDEFMKICESKKDSNPYDVQKHVFNYFDTVEFETSFDKELKEFAFSKGTTMNIMRRVAGIYFRNVCIDEFDMKVEDIDHHKDESES